MTTVSYRNYSGTAADLYDEFFVPAIAGPVSAGLLQRADLRPGERVVDVACGTGVIARAAAESVGPTGSVTGVDAAPDMIAVARSTEADGAPITWHEGEAAALPLPDESCDVALCQLSLMFIEDRAAAVREMHRVLVPGGRVLVNTPGRIQPLFETMEKAIVDHLNPDLGGFVRAVFSMHDPDELAGLLRDGGFVDTGAEVYDATLALPGPAEFLWSYINITPMGPLVAQAPAEAQAAMERDVVEEWAPHVSDGATPTVQPMALAWGRAAS